MIESISISLIGGVAAFFICVIVYGFRGRRRWFPRCLLWPDFIFDYLRFRRWPVSGHGWRKVAFLIFLQLAIYDARSSANMELIRPFTYLLKTNAGFTIERVVKEMDALQRSAGVMIFGCGNAPPSGTVTIASRVWLPAKSLKFSDLHGAESNANRYVIGMNSIRLQKL